MKRLILILKFILVVVTIYLMVLCSWAIPEIRVSNEAIVIVALAIIGIWASCKYVTPKDLDELTSWLVIF